MLTTNIRLGNLFIFYGCVVHRPFKILSAFDILSLSTWIKFHGAGMFRIKIRSRSCEGITIANSKPVVLETVSQTAFRTGSNTQKFAVHIFLLTLPLDQLDFPFIHYHIRVRTESLLKLFESRNHLCICVQRHFKIIRNMVS